MKIITFSSYPVGNYMFKANNRNTIARCEICSNLTIKTPERQKWHCSGVFIVTFKHISQIVLVFLLLKLSRYMSAIMSVIMLVEKMPKIWYKHKYSCNMSRTIPVWNFKPLSFCFEETIWFDVKASFASRPRSRLIRWYKKPGDITKEFW